MADRCPCPLRRTERGCKDILIQKTRTGNLVDGVAQHLVVVHRMEAQAAKNLAYKEVWSG